MRISPIFSITKNRLFITIVKSFCQWLRFWRKNNNNNNNNLSFSQVFVEEGVGGGGRRSGAVSGGRGALTCQSQYTTVHT
jgi:hypothetical protein